MEGKEKDQQRQEQRENRGKEDGKQRQKGGEKEGKNWGLRALWSPLSEVRRIINEISEFSGHYGGMSG